MRIAFERNPGLMVFLVQSPVSVVTIILMVAAFSDSLHFDFELSNILNDYCYYYYYCFPSIVQRLWL